MDKITLCEELRLIEKNESEINPAWKGAHLLLFFLSFVFGSFCTFCFHVLMYLFDEKCVLFPKLLSLKDLHRSGPTGIILDYMAKKDLEELPVDFVTTQWMDSSTCLLPTYVPLLSGICGLVWTTMFLMCSSGSRTLTGLQRPWRILPAIFVFSLAMGGLSMYTSLVTQYGLQDLCAKLGEFTGSTTCTYTINVATLAYERRIRGVYQATRLTMLSAWLHTCCWLGAACLALARIILVIDFRLVKVQADLIGNVEQMLERQEKHIRTDEFWIKDDFTNTTESNSSFKVRFKNKGLTTERLHTESTLHYLSQTTMPASRLSLVPDEHRRISIIKSFNLVPQEHRFIIKILHEIIDRVNIGSEHSLSFESSSTIGTEIPIKRQIGQDLIKLSSSDTNLSLQDQSLVPQKEAEELASRFRLRMGGKIKLLDSPTNYSPLTLTPSESTLNISMDMERAIARKEFKRRDSLKRSKGAITDLNRKSFTLSTKKSEISIETLKPPDDVEQQTPFDKEKKPEPLNELEIKQKPFDKNTMPDAPDKLQLRRKSVNEDTKPKPTDKLKLEPKPTDKLKLEPKPFEKDTKPEPADEFKLQQKPSDKTTQPEPPDKLKLPQKPSDKDKLNDDKMLSLMKDTGLVEGITSFPLPQGKDTDDKLLALKEPDETTDAKLYKEESARKTDEDLLAKIELDTKRTEPSAEFKLQQKPSDKVTKPKPPDELKLPQKPSDNDKLNDDNMLSLTKDTGFVEGISSFPLPQGKDTDDELHALKEPDEITDAKLISKEESARKTDEDLLAKIKLDTKAEDKLFSEKKSVKVPKVVLLSDKGSVEVLKDQTSTDKNLKTSKVVADQVFSKKKYDSAADDKPFLKTEPGTVSEDKPVDNNSDLFVIKPPSDIENIPLSLKETTYNKIFRDQKIHDSTGKPSTSETATKPERSYDERETTLKTLQSEISPPGTSGIAKASPGSEPDKPAETPSTSTQHSSKNQEQRKPKEKQD